MCSGKQGKGTTYLHRLLQGPKILFLALKITITIDEQRGYDDRRSVFSNKCAINERSTAEGY